MTVPCVSGVAPLRLASVIPASITPRSKPPATTSYVLLSCSLSHGRCPRPQGSDEPCVQALERLVEPVNVCSPRLGHVGPAAPRASNQLCNILYQLSGVVSAGQVLGDGQD